MKIVIGQAAYYLDTEKAQLLEDYPFLKRYAEYYHKDFDNYYENNVIIKDMDEEELAMIMSVLTTTRKLVIGYEDKLTTEKYGTDFKITIFDDYLE